MTLAERALDAGTDTASTNGATTLSVSPTGMQEGDWLEFGVCSAGGTGAHTNTAGGLSRVHDDMAGGTTIVTSTWKKKCGPSEAGPYTFSFGGSTRRATINVTCWSGGDPTDIVESAPTQVTGSSVSSIDAPGVDPAAVGGVHVIHIFSRTAGGSTQTFDAVANYTQENTESSTHATNANANGSTYSRALPNADATGDITCTVAISDRLNAASILLKPASTVSGTVAVTLPALVGDADGVVEVSGTIDITVPALAIDVDGVVEVSGTIGVTLPTLTVDVDGVVEVVGLVASVLPSLNADADGIVEVAGSIAITLPTLAVDADGVVGIVGSVAFVLPSLTAGVDGVVEAAGSIAISLPALVAEVDGVVEVAGSAAIFLPALATSLSGSIASDSVSGVLSAVLPALVVEVHGVVQVSSALQAVLPALVVDIDGMPVVDGPISITLPAVSIDIDGTIVGATIKATSAPSVAAIATSAPAVGDSVVSVISVLSLATSSPSVEG